MPQLQNVVLTDREGTPVNHTFVPQDIVSGVGTTVESSGTPIGANKFSVSMKKTGTRYVGEIRLVLPTVVTETINGVSRPAIQRTAYGTLKVQFDERSTEQERKNLIGMIASGLDPSKVLVNDSIVKLQGVY